MRAEPGKGILNQIVGNGAISASPARNGSKNGRGDHRLRQPNERLPAAGCPGFEAFAKDLRDISGFECRVDYKSIRLRESLRLLDGDANRPRAVK